MSGKFALIIGNTEYTDPGLAQLTAPFYTLARSVIPQSYAQISRTSSIGIIQGFPSR